MSGLFGTRASLAADLNLILQSVILVVIVSGSILAVKRKLKAHGRIMEIAASLNLFSILLVMGPSLLVNLSSLVANYPVLGEVTLTHALIGAPAASLGTTWAFKKFRRIRFWMIITVSLWLLGFLFGLTNYVLGYVL